MREPPDDPAACLERLYDTLGASLFRYAQMVLADRAEAEDAVHHVFASIAGGGLRGVADVERYLRRAVRNQCYSVLRSRKIRAALSDGVLLEAVRGDDDPGERIALERALARLPPEQREAVHLHLFEGMTFQEAADATGESINTIAARYRYAMGKLRVLLTRP